MNDRKYRPNIVGPLILISAGVLLLLNQAGRLPWSVWSTLWRFWPVILILMGLEVLIGVSRSTALYIAGLIIAVVVLASVVVFAIYVGEQPVSSRPAAGTETVIESMHDADRGQIRLRFGLGTLEVGALTDSPNFVEGGIEYSRNSRQVEKLFRVGDGQAKFSLEARSQSIPFWTSRDIGEHWKLEFTTRIPLELEVVAGAGSVQMDLSKLKVTQLDVKGGAGQTSITFPAAAGSTTASVSSGVGQITVQIPDNVGAKIHVSKALAAVHVEGSRFVRSGDEYVSTNYQTAENKLNLEIKAAVGTIIIR